MAVAITINAHGGRAGLPKKIINIFNDQGQFGKIEYKKIPTGKLFEKKIPLAIKKYFSFEKNIAKTIMQQMLGVTTHVILLEKPNNWLEIKKMILTNIKLEEHDRKIHVKQNISVTANNKKIKKIMLLAV